MNRSGCPPRRTGTSWPPPSRSATCPSTSEALFLEVIVDDSSDFETELHVRGVTRHGYRILEVHGPVVPNTIASVLLHIRDVTGLMPHIYFRWTEGNPVINLLRFLFLGEGEIAPVTREVLREAVPGRHQAALGPRRLTKTEHPESGPLEPLAPSLFSVTI